MKSLIILAFGCSLLGACDARVTTPAPVEKNTTIITPPAEEKKVEKNTTIVVPAPGETTKQTTTTTETK